MCNKLAGRWGRACVTIGWGEEKRSGRDFVAEKIAGWNGPSGCEPGWGEASRV